MNNKPIVFLEKKAKKYLRKNIALGGTVQIRYKETDFMVGAPYDELMACCKRLDDMEEEELKNMLKCVDNAIDTNLPLADKGLLKDKEFMDLCLDITIWFANEIITDKQDIDNLEFVKM